MSTFVQYWKTPTVRFEEDLIAGGNSDAFDHTASDHFRDLAVRVGDVVYVTNFTGGSLRVLGRLVVAKIVNAVEAERLLGYPVWRRATTS